MIAADKYDITDVTEYNQIKRSNSELVSFIEWNGVLLNMSYIYPKFVLMCTPSADQIYKRNDIRIVADFIKEKHGDHFFLFNVHDNSYDIKYFDEKVIFKPFPDHCSPSISYFSEASRAIQAVFAKDPKCTFFVHCKAGRGRSGTIICAYQIFSGAVKHVAEAIEMVNEKRSPEHMSITVPSQLRFLHYFGYQCSQTPPKQKIQILRVEFSPEFNREMHCTITLGIPFIGKELIRKKFDGHIAEFSYRDLVVENEFVISVFELNRETSIVRCQLHSDFLIKKLEKISKNNDGTYKVHIDKYELDGPHNRKTSKNFPENFLMNLTYLVL